MDCPLCFESETLCPLCLAQPDLAHDEAKRAEGLRLALVFAERGVLPELKDCDPDRTLPMEWTTYHAQFVARGVRIHRAIRRWRR